MILSNGAAMPTNIDTIADTTPLFADASYYSTSALPLTNTWAAYGAIYRSQLWVNTVIRKLARATARLPLDVKQQLEENSQQRLDGDPLTQLLTRPNPNLDPFRLWEWTSSTYDVYGEAFWLKLRDNTGQVRELHPMHPTNVIVRQHPETREWFYIYSTGVRNVSMLPPIPAADVVPFLSYNPDNLMRGWSNLEPLRQTLLNEDSARRASASWWNRGARPSVALTHPGQLSMAAQERLRKTWESEHSGADLMGGTAVLEEGMEAKIIQLNAEEMQYIESRKLNREEVCAVYDVPPPVVHILDHATYSNITEQLRSMYRDTMTPRLEGFESVLDHHLVPDFHPNGDVFCRFNLDEVMRGEFETRATAVRELVQSGVLMPSEGRPMFGLPKAGPEADFLYGNAALVPLGSSVRGAQEVDTQGDLIPTPVAGPPSTASGGGGRGPNGGSPPRQLPAGRSYDHRSIARRIGQVKAQGGNVRAALISEHTDALNSYYTELLDAFDGSGDTPVARREWDQKLGEVLTGLGLTTARQLGQAVAKKLGGQFEDSNLTDWITTDSHESAASMNTSTAEDYHAATSGTSGTDRTDALAAFRDALLAKAGEVAHTRVSYIGGFAEQAAAHDSGAATKTWITGPNPRPSHSAMSGETVPLGEPFSNGMNGPGDPSGGADEVAGCNCFLSFEMP